MLTELRQTITEGINLMVSANKLAERLGMEPGQVKDEFDINTYRETLTFHADSSDHDEGGGLSRRNGRICACRVLQRFITSKGGPRGRRVSQSLVLD